MIHFIDTAMWYPAANGLTVILQPTTLSVPTDRRVGILGRPKSGLTTILNMIAGLVPPSLGRIVRDARLSPLVGYQGAVNLNMTAAENAAFMARLYEADPTEVVDFVLALAAVDEAFQDVPAAKYPPGLRGRVAYAISYALRFDCYLIDGAAGPRQPAFRKRCDRMLMEVYRDSGALFASHDPETIRTYCDLVLVLKNQTLIPFTHVEEAITYHDED